MADAMPDYSKMHVGSFKRGLYFGRAFKTFKLSFFHIRSIKDIKNKVSLFHLTISSNHDRFS